MRGSTIGPCLNTMSNSGALRHSKRPAYCEAVQTQVGRRSPQSSLNLALNCQVHAITAFGTINLCRKNSAETVLKRVISINTNPVVQT